MEIFRLLGDLGITWTSLTLLSCLFRGVNQFSTTTYVASITMNWGTLSNNLLWKCLQTPSLDRLEALLIGRMSNNETTEREVTQKQINGWKSINRFWKYFLKQATSWPGYFRFRFHVWSNTVLSVSHYWVRIPFDRASICCTGM